MTAYQAVEQRRPVTPAIDPCAIGTESVITELADMSVAVVGYHDPGSAGSRDPRPADRIDIIDRRRLVEIASLTRADAVRLADRLCDVASGEHQPAMVQLIRDAAVEAVEDAAAALQGDEIRSSADFDLLVAEIAVAALNAAAGRLRELGAAPEPAHRHPSPTPPSPIKE